MKFDKELGMQRIGKAKSKVGEFINSVKRSIKEYNDNAPIRMANKIENLNKELELEKARVGLEEQKVKLELLRDKKAKLKPQMSLGGGFGEAYLDSPKSDNNKKPMFDIGI